jgi:hypothetical protein
MRASQLERILANESSSISLSRRSPTELARRFESLRCYGLLPKGRGYKSRELSLREITSTLLGMAAANAGFAGLAAKILADLRPVGGSGIAFAGAPSLGRALELVLEDPKAASLLVEVRVSESEIYTNGHGRAAITYLNAGGESTSHYVGKLAISLLQPGAEIGYDPRNLVSSVIVETVIYPSLLNYLIRQLRDESRFGQRQHIPEIQEEDDEETLKAVRAQRLDLTPRSRFLNVGVDNQVTWPSEETVVTFEGRKLILMPPTKNHTTSIHVDLHGQKLNEEAALTLINRFLSVLTWCDDQYAIAQGGWSGNPVPVPVSKRDLAFSTAYQWVFDRKSPSSTSAQKAIAIYRDARNAEQNFLVSYAVLSYYKIIELKHKGRGDTKAWLRGNFEALKLERSLAGDISRFTAACGSEKPSEYLYRACRVAVAHANQPYSSDPDDANELRRLHVAASILRALARRFIESELGVSNCVFDGS